MNPETKLERRLVAAVKKAGGLALKTPAQWYRGIPDRLVLLPGGYVEFVEMKVKGGRTSAHQKLFQKTLLNIGISCVIIEGETELEEWINDRLTTEL